MQKIQITKIFNGGISNPALPRCELIPFNRIPALSEAVFRDIFDILLIMDFIFCMNLNF